MSAVRNIKGNKTENILSSGQSAQGALSFNDVDQAGLTDRDTTGQDRINKSIIIGSHSDVMVM